MPIKSNYKTLGYVFGILVQELRQKARLTQPELAQLVGISKRAVLNWEVGGNYPQINRLRRLVEIFLDKGCLLSTKNNPKPNFSPKKQPLIRTSGAATIG